MGNMVCPPAACTASSITCTNVSKTFGSTQGCEDGPGYSRGWRATQPNSCACQNMLQTGLASLAPLLAAYSLSLSLIKHLQLQSVPTRAAQRTDPACPPHLDTQDTLAQQHVAHGAVHVHVLGVARGHHVAVLELHGLGTGSAQLARHNHLAALGALLHHEAQHTVASPAGEEGGGKDAVSAGVALRQR